MVDRPEVSYHLNVVLTNETEGHTFSDWMEEVPDFLLRDDGTPDFGAIFRQSRSEYGRCQSSVYVDTSDGVKRVGWFFVKRDEYDRPVRTCQNPYCEVHYARTYLRGAWVTVVAMVEPARPATYATVEVGQ